MGSSLTIYFENLGIKFLKKSIKVFKKSSEYWKFQCKIEKYLFSTHECNKIHRKMYSISACVHHHRSSTIFSLKSQFTEGILNKKIVQITRAPLNVTCVWVRARLTVTDAALTLIYWCSWKSLPMLLMHAIMVMTIHISSLMIYTFSHKMLLYWNKFFFPLAVGGAALGELRQ